MHLYKKPKFLLQENIFVLIPCILGRFSDNCVDSFDPQQLMKYKHIQRVANLCNEVLQELIVPTSTVGTITSFSVSFAVVIRSISKSPNLPLVLLLIICGTYSAFYLIFFLRALADVHDKSHKALQQVKVSTVTVHRRVEQKWTKRFLKSCRPIRMKFGGSNFVEMLTPLNCISHAMQMSAQILLLGKE